MPDEEQTPLPERPAVFNRLTGWIGGLTAVVLALAGLRAAYQQLSPPKAEPAAASAVASPVDQTAENSVVDESAVAEEAAEGSTEPLAYTGNYEGRAVTLSWVDGLWEETDGEYVARYEELSRDGTTINAIDRDRKTYIRWPIAGGMLQESEDRQTWTDSYRAEPVEDGTSAS